MTQLFPKQADSKQPKLVIRPIHYGDLDELGRLFEQDDQSGGVCELQDDGRGQDWRQPFKFLRLLPTLLKAFSIYVAEQDGKICGVIQVSPFNRIRSTWQVDRVLTTTAFANLANPQCFSDIGSQLLRHCFETVWEARTWLVEVNVSNNSALALYRQNGFQPLAHKTYWALSPEQQRSLADREPDLQNLLPICQADAQLLYQLETASMPPLVRQVFDHQIKDFKASLLGNLVDGFKHWVNHTDTVSAYVFEPQRKAAIGYFRLHFCRRGSRPHKAHLTVHPAYTWLYPELLAQMTRVTRELSDQPLQLVSSDYQPEREEYLTQIGATRVEHTLMMSRSVWHKLRESKQVSLDGLQLSGMLQGLQPKRTPVPGRMSWMVDPMLSSKKEGESSQRSDESHPPEPSK